MKIAIIHYHLKTGGVTTVIRQQINALKSRCELLLLSGEAPETDFEIPVVHVPGLAYDEKIPPSTTPEAVANAVNRAVIKAFDTPADVLHVHNPLLSKNRYLPNILTRLQETGHRLLLHVHDLAEDGRPQVYCHTCPYPCDCHYAVINSRDHAKMAQSGLLPEGLHLLPNVVNHLPADSPPPADGQCVLYPVRAIRRKNIGEALMLSLFFYKKLPLMITQPPNSAADIPAYEMWKSFAEQHNLNVRFEAGLHQDFAELVSRSRYMITTSISEGFGFSFLEAWTAGKYLNGRLLPDICRDFTQNGVHLGHLYATLKVPVEWAGGDAFQEKWLSSMTAALARFRVSGGFVRLQALLSRIMAGGLVDFGHLDEYSQAMVLKSVLTRSGYREKLVAINPFLADFGKPADPEILMANETAVHRHYHPDTYGEKLMTVYEQVCARKVHHAVDKAALLTQYLEPENLSLLKWGQFEEQVAF